MQIASLSGKGGTGKTFVSVNLASVVKNLAYIDCDVEEPNGHLFFKPENVEQIQVDTLVPKFNAERCRGCRECQNFCRFNAIAFIKTPLLFTELCHSCGGCAIVCPNRAIGETPRNVGTLFSGISEGKRIVGGLMNSGEASAVPIIKKVLKTGLRFGGDSIVDCPPGSGCSVMESIKYADICLLVAEATAFGFHNFKMIYELALKMGKRCAVVVNKSELSFNPLEEFCLSRELPILMRIPYKKEIATLTSNGQIAVKHDKETEKSFRAFWLSLRQFFEKTGNR